MVRWVKVPDNGRPLKRNNVAIRGLPVLRFFSSVFFYLLFIYLQADLWSSVSETILKLRVSLHLVLALVPSLPPHSSSFLILSLCSSSPLILFLSLNPLKPFFSFSVRGGELEDGDMFTFESKVGKDPPNE